MCLPVKYSIGVHTGENTIFVITHVSFHPLGRLRKSFHVIPLYSRYYSYTAYPHMKPQTPITNHLFPFSKSWKYPRYLLVPIACSITIALLDKNSYPQSSPTTDILLPSAKQIKNIPYQPDLHSLIITPPSPGY